mmetsp:Transcript_15348/g.23334  ORF Transcript_15348/g.23334 Transcript_15348/m.23334 type:complete len:93 (+) Transcript_15348:135-413(+)
MVFHKAKQKMTSIFYSIPNPMAEVVIASFSFSNISFLELYVGKSIRLKQVCPRGYINCDLSTPWIVNFFMFPSLLCKTAKPRAGTPEVPVTN